MKKYLKELNDSELKQVIKSNNKLQEEISRILYENNMECQEDEGNLLLGSNWNQYIDIKDNYSSFYLVLRNWREFIDNIDSAYLCEKAIDLYNYIIRKKEIYENMNPYNDHFNSLNEHLEKKSKELLKIIEDQLHEYEEFPTDEDIFYYLIDDINEVYQNCYIIPEEKNYILYEDISYIKRYN